MWYWYDLRRSDGTGQDQIVAALARIDGGRLQLAAYRPLDAKSVRYLFSLSTLPGPDNQICMRPDNWEYALNCSAGMGNIYTDQNEEAYLSYWKNGIGLSLEGEDIDPWAGCRDLVAIEPRLVVTTLGIYYQLHDDT